MSAPQVTQLALTLAHLVRMARMDAGYARWRAGALAKEDPQWFSDLPEQLDAELIHLGIKWPAPFVEPPSRLPKLARGPRALPTHRFFHDSL